MLKLNDEISGDDMTNDKPRNNTRNEQKSNEMVDASLKSAPEPGQKTFNDSMCRTAINSTTLSLTEPTEEQIARLDIRAASYGIAGDFQKGLRDAELMIRLAPDLALGYLRAGELCSSFGYQLRAMIVYSQGLSNVPQGSILQQRYEVAKAKSEERVDGLASAPYDIVTRILQYLRLEEQVKLLKVSKTWNQVLSDCTFLWSTLELEHKNDFTTADFSFLGHVGHCIRDLSLGVMGSDDCEAILSEIANADFCRLEKITMEKPTLESHAALLSALTRVSKTLKSLHIKSAVGYETMVPCQTLLSTCPNLEYLYYSSINQSLTEQNARLLLTSCLPNLTDLTLISKNLDLVVIENLLRGSPALRYLFLRPCSTEIMKTINTYCENLVGLSLEDKYFSTFWHLNKKSVTSTAPGMKVLAVDVDNPRDVISLFNKHSVTLVTLRLVLNVSSDPTWNEFVDAFDNLTNVRNLELVCLNKSSCEVAAALIQRLTTLTELRFAHEGVISGNNLISAIIGLPDLQVFEIGSVETTYHELRDLFQGLVKEKSSLEKLTLSKGYHDKALPAGGILTILPNIPTLREFDFGSLTCSWSNLDEPAADINGFFESMRDHPSIETIVVSKIPGFTCATLRHLMAIKHLKQVRLTGVHICGVIINSPINIIQV